MRIRTPASLVVALAVVIGSCVDAVAPPDNISPPGGVTVTLVGTNSARVTWNAPPEAEFVDSYNVFRDGVKIGESITTSYLDNNLAQGVTYKYRVSANGQLGIVGLLSEESAAATLTVPDVTPPTVTSTNPAPGAAGIALGSKVSATFSEAMNPATITTATFFLKTSGGALIPGTVTYDAPTRTAQLTPTEALPNAATVSATVTTGVKDAAGNALASDFTFSFTTRDDAPPSVVSTSPVGGATGVAVTAPISVTFNELIDVATLTASSFAVAATSGGAAVTGTVSFDAASRTGTFTPSAPLAGSTGYTATVAGSVKDPAGNAMGTPFSFSFTTADITPPSVVSVSPANDATEVLAGAAIVVTFSEAMDAATMNASTVTLKLTSSGALVGGNVSYNAATMTASFIPSANLAFATGYTVLVTTDAKDAAGNSIASAFSSTFATTGAPDTTPPTIVSVSPSDGATGVAVNATVSVTFSEAMNPATISSANITLKNVATSAVVSATVAYDAGTKTATITPSSALAFGTAYSLTVSGGVSDLAGNGLAGAFVSSFTTTTAPDNTPPTVLSTVPAHDASNVSVLTPITVTFSEAMNPATINNSTIALKVTTTGTIISGRVSYDALSKIAAFFPAAGTLAFATTYTLTASGAADAAGNPMTAAVTAVFTTAVAPDLTPPTVTASSPVNGATGVATTVAPTVTFSEPMNAATINGSTITLSVTATSGPVAGSVSYSAATNTASFTPFAALSGSTGYTLTVTTGARDLAANALVSQFTASFTTADVTAPTVLSTLPANGAVGVLVNSTVTVTFSEAMNPPTINGSTITLRVSATSSPVAGTVSYNSGTNAATFTPTSPLSGSTGYTLAVTTGVKDVAGNALASQFTASFTTADVTAPTVLSTSPINGVVGVLRNAVFTVTFSEAMNPATINSSSVTVTVIPAFTTESESVPGTVSFDAGSNTATFTPSAILRFQAAYTVTVTTAATDVAGNPLASTFTFGFTSIQKVSGKPYFQGTNDVSADPSKPEIHVHLRFTQDGTVLGHPDDCEPLPTANCDLFPQNAAGADAIGPLDDTQGGTIGIAATVTQITGTFNDPNISFTITLANSRTFNFVGTVTNSDTMHLTISGTTLPAPVAIVLARF